MSAHVLIVTSTGAAAHVVVPVLAACEAVGLRVRAIDVGGAGGGGGGVADRVRRALLGESAERRLRRELDGSPPDVAVAFDAHATMALSLARDHAKVPAAVVAVVGELDPGPEWRAADADRYLCVDDVAAVALADQGVEAERILVVGPLGERLFVDAAREDRGALRTRFGLKTTPVVVDVAGIGAEAAGQVALQLSMVTGSEHLTYLFDAGADADAAGVLRRQVPALGLRAKLFGTTPDAPLLWRSADLVIGRAQPGPVARAMLLGTRLAVWVDDTSPAQVRLGGALEARRRAVIARGPLQLAGAVEAALRAATLVPAPDGADVVADVLVAVAGDRRGVVEERLAAARAEAAAQERGVADAARAAAPAGGLEDLGGDDDVPLGRTTSGPPPRAAASAPPPPRPTAGSVDDALAELKRRSAGPAAAPRPSAGPARPAAGARTADDALAALKRKMAAQPKKP